MRKILSSRRAKFLASLIAALACAAAAFAYWTATTTPGNGSGSTSGTGPALTVSNLSTPSGMVPGGSAQNVSFQVNNTDTTQNAHLSSASVAFTNGTDPTSTTNPPAVTKIVSGSPADATSSCPTTNFTLTQPGTPSTAQQTILPSSHLSFDGTGTDPAAGTIKLNESGTNQDGCKNVTVHLVVTPSP